RRPFAGGRHDDRRAAVYRGRRCGRDRRHRRPRRARCLAARATMSDDAPDLQQLVEKAGRRRAAELGETYDPKNPEHAGYPRITAQEWAEFDREMAAWQVRRRSRYGR